MPDNKEAKPKGKGGARIKKGSAEYYSKKYGQRTVVGKEPDRQPDFKERQLPVGDRD